MVDINTNGATINTMRHTSTIRLNILMISCCRRGFELLISITALRALLGASKFSQTVIYCKLENETPQVRERPRSEVI